MTSSFARAFAKYHTQTRGGLITCPTLTGYTDLEVEEMTVQEWCDWIDRNGTCTNRFHDHAIRLLRAADAVIRGGEQLSALEARTREPDANHLDQRALMKALLNQADLEDIYMAAKKEAGLQ